MKKLLLIGFMTAFSNVALADAGTLDKYFNKEGYRVMLYVGNGLQQCFKAKENANIQRICEMKAGIALKKASKLGLSFEPGYFLSDHFLNGLKSSIDENNKFKKEMMKAHGVKAMAKLRPHEKAATLLLDDFKNRKFL